MHHFHFDSAITWFCVCVCSAVIFYSSVLQSSTVKLQPNMVHIRVELLQGHQESKSLHQILCRRSSWHMAQCNKQTNSKLFGADLHICWKKTWGLRAQLKSSLSQWEEALPLSLLQNVSTHIAINIGLVAIPTVRENFKIKLWVVHIVLDKIYFVCKWKRFCYFFFLLYIFSWLPGWRFILGSHESQTPILLFYDSSKKHSLNKTFPLSNARLTQWTWGRGKTNFMCK